MLKQRRARLIVITAICLVALGVGAPAQGVAASNDSIRNVPDNTGEWLWPVTGPRVVATPFRAPAQPWLSGHRGIDVAAVDTAGQVLVRAPSDGVVAFVGTVVERELITIAHAGNLVTTLEPVRSELAVGAEVAAGDEIGMLATGGHTATGLLHFGVRWHGNYINPLLLYEGVRRAVLLPCC